MTKHLYLVCALSILAAMNIANGQHLSKPKKIKADGNYMHAATGTIFPTTIGNFQREEITAFDKQKDDIGASYKAPGMNNPIEMTIYLYPAGEASDIRFRDEYFRCLQAIAYAADKDLEAESEYCSYRKDDYKINGYSAKVQSGRKTRTFLELYECGNWFLKIRVTAGVADSFKTSYLHQQIVPALSPVNIVKQSKLTFAPNMIISREALADSILLGGTMNSSIEAALWAQNHVDSLEKLSGFPSLYLDMHIATSKAFVSFADKYKEYPMTDFTKNYLEQLRALIANDYLDEYLMEKYSQVMIVPEGKTFDVGSYHKWLEKHPFRVDMNKRFYYVYYQNKGERNNRKH